jgi:hypothetical protein
VLIGIFDGRIVRDAGQRVDLGLREMLPEPEFLIETQHRLAAFEEGLHRDAFLHGGKAGAAEKTAQPAARAGAALSAFWMMNSVWVAYIGVATR